MVFVVALFYAVVFGLPTYFFATLFELTHWWVSVVGGFLIGAVPGAISSWPNPNDDYKVRIGNTMMDHYMIYGISIKVEWFHYLCNVFEMGCYGMVGGFAAWLVWRYIKISYK